jgi:hypothetical protein
MQTADAVQGLYTGRYVHVSYKAINHASMIPASLDEVIGRISLDFDLEPSGKFSALVTGLTILTKKIGQQGGISTLNLVPRINQQACY